MAFDWRENLELARWLQNNVPPGISMECALRCAIGRAYYAAYGHALNYAKAYLSFVPQKASEDHGRLRSHLKQKRRQQVSESLDRLRGWRNDGDYEPNYPGDLGITLQYALEDADYVFSGLPPPAPRAS
jgi:hypothetical protein